MRSKLFEHLVSSFEAKTFVLAAFMQKFERTDVEYLNISNLMMDNAQ